MAITTLPDRYVFVRKAAKGVRHIARRNIQTRKPIHLSECSLDVGAHKDWGDVATEADTGTVCKKCARSVFGFRWYAIDRGEDPNPNPRAGS